MKKLLLAILLIGMSANLNANLSISANNKDAKEMKQEGLEQIETFSKACDSGDTKGCFNLGYMYDRGKGVKKDYTKAVEFYTKGCDGGDVRSCTYLGLMYGKGKGVKKDMSKANKLFKKLAMVVMRMDA